MEGSDNFTHSKIKPAGSMQTCIHDSAKLKVFLNKTDVIEPRKNEHKV